MADTWELPLLWISCSVSCFPSWAAPRAASSALLQETCQARRGSGCVGKISVIMSIQVCLGFFNLIEKSQRHYSSTSAPPWRSRALLYFPWPCTEQFCSALALSGGPCHGTTRHQAPPCTVSVLPIVPAVPAEGWGEEGGSVVASTSMTCQSTPWWQEKPAGSRTLPVPSTKNHDVCLSSLSPAPPIFLPVRGTA